MSELPASPPLRTTGIAPVLGKWRKESSRRKEELSPESPATEAFVEQWAQDGVFQKGWEDAAAHKRSWLLVNPLSLPTELLEEDHVGVSGGYLGRRKTVLSVPAPVLDQ